MKYFIKSINQLLLEKYNLTSGLIATISTKDIINIVTSIATCAGVLEFLPGNDITLSANAGSMYAKTGWIATSKIVIDIITTTKNTIHSTTSDTETIAECVWFVL
ncbi:hypothetical protein GCM10008985_27560 [Halococcus dombrowskii]|uniref:Uncharacterized protein n=1 Tax=Halococcus dombrowskii TaxID=179637 RepID=A0AAV3SJX8_HALDO